MSADTTTVAPRGWWSRNRRSLFAVPVLLVLAMAANGQRAVQYWWPAEPRDLVPVAADGSATLTNTGRDANGLHERSITVRVLSTTPTTTTEDFPGDEPTELEVPPDLVAWRVTVHITTPPDDKLSGCQTTVLDATDREYVTGTQVVDPTASGPLTYSCVPADDPGPELAFVAGPPRLDSGLDGDPDPRPPEYDQYVYVVMPADVVPDRIRFRFEYPTYAELPLSPARG